MQTLKPLVGIVVPVGGRVDPSEWMMAIRSIVDQDYPLDRIRVFQVVRVEDDLPTPIISTTSPQCEILYYHAKSSEPPSVFEQIEMGYSKAILYDCEFVCVCSSNDVMEPFKVSDEAYTLIENPDAMVAFGDLVMWDHGDDSVFIDSNFNFDPKVGTTYANGVPDICMIRCSVFRDIPFCALDGEASNDILFFRILEKYGLGAFVKTERPNYIYRQHERALRNNVSMHMNGKKRLVEFLKTFKPLLDTGLSVDLRLRRVPPTESKDMVVAYV